MFSSVLDPIQTHIRQQPQQLAIINDSGSYSFATLGLRIEAIRQVLRAHKPHCVLIYGHKQLDAAAAMLACAFEAMTFTFADIANPAERIGRIASVTQADLILLTCLPPEGSAFPALPTQMTDALAERAPLRPAQAAEPSTLLYVLTTSGTTGEPKGVKISRGNYEALARWALPLLHPEPRGAHVNHACLSFDLGIMDVFLTLAAGKTLIMLDHRNNIRPRKNLSLLASPAIQVESWFSTPGFLELMCADAQFSQHSLPNLKKIAIGGEALLPALATTLHERFPQAEILHCYGPTEAACMTHAAPIGLDNLPASPPLSLGCACGDNQLGIIDAQQHPVPSGTVGEIVLYGPQISPGYLPETDPRNALFGDGPAGRYYRTGDQGYLDSQGQLFVKGRDDGQIKWLGNRIETGDIEAVTRQLDAVQQAVVLTEKNTTTIKDLILCLHLAPDTAERRASLRHELAQRLPAYMVPRIIHFTGPFPLTLHGKTDRVALMRQYQAEVAAID
ncbi:MULTISPECIES: AMP-binding protein [Dickeya]|uniref:D-alanine--poly(Phosphoribitol) ligase subunit 1 n=1 Tax=Dickeya aquatica TaxID=1401087 RepID=A0A375AG55_9GAMM|nr:MULTISPECIES: AMP-binding protein [Dickeya]SLM65070.1 D-alanine--poly(phosphoribitol) ligase subunit 1 [Dickeya aquatica]